MKRSTQSLAVLGLSALSLAALTPASHAVAAAGYNLAYSLPTFNFTPSVAAGSADALIFTFAPQSTQGFTSSNAAELVASNFNYTGNWQVDTTGLENGFFGGQDVGHFAYTSSNNELTSASLYNNGTPTGLDFSTFSLDSPDDGVKTATPTTTSIYVPFSSVGNSASFDIGYYDDPTLSDFTLQEQYTDPTNNATVTKTLIVGTFSGTQFTPAAGPGGGTPGGGTPGTPAVPEPSSLALMGLGALPLLGLARRRAARA